MNIVEILKNTLSEILEVEQKDIHLEHPNDISHGDFSTNIAMVLYQNNSNIASSGKIEDFIDKNAPIWDNPRDFAADIVEKLNKKNLPEIGSVSVAGPGFINIKLSTLFFENSIKNILEKGDSFGYSDIWKNKKILVEHSSPNIFKPFHIGHMMNNTVGESIVRLCMLSGADVTAISYPSDVSLGIGKAVWQLMEYGVDELNKIDDLEEQMTFLGKCYSEGTKYYDENPEIESRIREITEDIYEHRDTDAYKAYKIGRDLNLEYFKKMTARLGSEFDGYIYESEAGAIGSQIIKENIGTVYEESDGAVIYRGEQDGLHTRVFINKDGKPTYEAKDTGLLKLKFDRYNPDLSIFITDSQQGPYFDVVAAAAGKINPDWQNKTIHMTHGRMQFKGEKMSSRLGNTPIVSDILDTVKVAVYAKAGEREMTDERADMISIAALKYTILRTQPGKSINFDPETSLSFEGDSGPYLQYTYARCQSILKKANEAGIKISDKRPDSWQTLNIEKYLYRLPEIFKGAFVNHAPHNVAGYIILLAQEFNSWYGQGKIINADNSETGYKLAIVSAAATVIKKSLWALGIESPESM